MNEPLLRELLNEVADDVEPTDRLDAIRARTGRSSRRYWIPAGAALVAASVVGAFALGGGPSERPEAPGPAGTTIASPSPSRPTPLPPELRAVAVYYVGDTPDGPRLYREFRRVAGDPLTAAVAAAVGRASDDRPLAPLDPDYSVPWPPGTSASARVVADQELIEVSLSGDVEGSLRDRGPLSAEEAGLAVEQLVRTAQGVVQERLPVRFLLYEQITDHVLGVPTSEPLAQGPDLDVLARVSLGSPSEGQVVDNDEPLTVSGAGNSFEGNIVTWLERPDGSEVIGQTPTIAGWLGDRLFPFEVDLDLTEVSRGDYVVLSRTDDPSGEDRFHVDTRAITVVD